MLHLQVAASKTTNVKAIMQSLKEENVSKL